MKIGRIVLYTYPKAEQAPGHASEVPAIVVRVHTPDIVNLRVFSDSVAHGAEYRMYVKKDGGDDGFFASQPKDFQEDFAQE